MLTMVEWGSVADWVSGLATAGTLILMYLLLRKESAALKANREQILRAERDRERAQARLVSAWVGDIHASTPVGQREKWIVHLHVRNGSDEPVSDVEVHVLVEDTQMVRRCPVLGPGVNDIDPIGIPRSDSEHPNVGEAHILFTDAEGRRWERLGSELSRVFEGEGE